MWRNRFGRGFGPVVWQTTDDDDDDDDDDSFLTTKGKLIISLRLLWARAFPYFNFRTIWRIFTKIGVNVLTSEDIQNL